MAAVIRFKTNVGTTYKRALTRKILARDRSGSLCLTAPEAIGRRHRYVGITATQGARRCASPATSISPCAPCTARGRGSGYASARPVSPTSKPRTRPIWLDQRPLSVEGQQRTHLVGPAG